LANKNDEFICGFFDTRGRRFSVAIIVLRRREMEALEGGFHKALGAVQHIQKYC
jgi:hypothetical protein